MSIIAVIAIFGYAFFSPENEFIAKGFPIIGVLILGTFINAPHFMASYLLFYRNKAQITQHRWAAVYVPLILFLIIIYAFLTPNPEVANPRVNAAAVDLLTVVSAILLAWHYTGQAWGMTGAFAYIHGIRMDEMERKLIRCGYHTLLVWHIIWACLFIIRNDEPMIARNFSDFAKTFSNQVPSVLLVYNVWSVVVLLTIPLGIFGFIRIRRRTGIMPPLRCFAPWVAIYLWYALIWAYPEVFWLLQIFHALQYLVFPLRVELNQYSAKQKRSDTKQFLHGVAYYLVLVVVGFAVFELPAVSLVRTGGNLNFLGVIAAFVNIHHYFIDGAIWKIRNPQVRKDLFAHLKLA